MKKYSYLIIIVLISSLVLTGCLLSNISQVPATEQSGISYLTKGGLLSNLVGLWSFDEEEGDTAYDNSGNGNDGTVNGAIWDDGKFGKALSFDGVDNYVGVGHHIELNPTSAITVECFAKLDSVIPGPVLVRKMDTYSLQVTYFDGESKIEGWVKIGGGWKGVRGVTGGVIIQTNTWYHFAFTYDGIALKTYVNGQLDRSASVTGSIDSTTKLLDIGRCGPEDGSGEGWYTDGFIDEVRIWDNALSPDTIADHAAGIYGFNGLLAPYVAPPKAFKAGRSIPLKWQYTDYSGNEVDSSAAEPSVKVLFKGTIETPADETIFVEDPGESGYRYDSDKKTWQFNWQTKGLNAGSYEIWITSNQTGQVNGPFLIDLV